VNAFAKICHIDLNLFFRRIPSVKKIELIREIAKSTNLTQTQATQALEATLNIIKKTLHRNEDIRLVGFGSFKVTQRQARTGINPQTKRPIQIPATNVAKFVPGKEMKEMLNTPTTKNRKK
jgi:nucleoid DNA-binding protein